MGMIDLPYNQPDARGHFGPYGGVFVAETLMAALEELRSAYEAAPRRSRLPRRIRVTTSSTTSAGPARSTTPSAGRSMLGGAQIYLKREDLNHTGAHKINNSIGQALLARRMGKPRVIAETGAGQHGVATATVAARYGMECVVYMGSEDIKRQAANVYRMKLLGATVVPVETRLEDAQGCAERGDARLGDQCRQHLLHHRHGGRTAPLSDDGARFQAVIGKECRGRCRRWPAASRMR